MQSYPKDCKTLLSSFSEDIQERINDIVSDWLDAKTWWAHNLDNPALLLSYMRIGECNFFVPYGVGRVLLTGKKFGAAPEAPRIYIRFMDDHVVQPYYKEDCFIYEAINTYAKQTQAAYALLSSVHNKNDFLGYELVFFQE